MTTRMDQTTMELQAEPRGDPAATAHGQADGDPDALDTLVRRHYDAMLRLARGYVPSPALAEEVVQETWAAVIEGRSRFQGRSSLKTWIFAILINRAKSLGVRERRSVPFSALGQQYDPALSGPSSGQAHELINAQVERHDQQTPERALELKQQLRLVQRSLKQLSPAQREVVTSIDLLGHSASETCEQLAISAVNQRVLLHRGRSSLRHALARAA